MNKIQLSPEQIKLQLINQLNIEHLPTEQQAEVVTKMSTIILDRLGLALMAELPEEALPHIDKLLEGNQTEVIQTLITKYVKNIDDLTAEVIEGTLNEYHANIKDNLDT